MGIVPGLNVVSVALFAQGWTRKPWSGDSPLRAPDQLSTFRTVLTKACSMREDLLQKYIMRGGHLQDDASHSDMPRLLNGKLLVNVFLRLNRNVLLKKPPHRAFTVRLKKLCFIV